MALIGNGAKALTYYAFGPEYNYPGNCYSDSRVIDKLLSQQREAHTLIARAEDVLWPATKVASKVAILAHRSSEVWDPSGATKWEDQQQHVVAYQADQFGLYLALAVHGGVPVDFIDEDALANATLMAGYTVLFVTQPNVPSASTVTAAAWVRQGGKLVLSGGAAVADEYNTPLFTFSNLTGAQLSAMPRTVVGSNHENPGALNCYAGDVLLQHGGNSTVARVHAYGANLTVLALQPNATVLATFASGGLPAVFETAVGAGSVTQFAWQPGLSYLPNASEYVYIPNPQTQLPAVVRELLVGLTQGSFTPPVRLALHSGSAAAAAAGVVGMETPMSCTPVSAVLPSSSGCVVTVLNWGGDAEVGAELEMQIDLPAAVFGSPPQVGLVFSARTGETLSHAPAGGQTVAVVAQAAYADFVVLVPKQKKG